MRMNRRNFIGFGVLAMATLPATLSALSSIDFRKEKPDVWTAHTVDDAIKAMYGDIKPAESGVTVKAPKVASNGGAIPVTVKSDIPAKTVALFQDVNPEATVCVYNCDKDSIIDYFCKIKMKKSGTIIAILEGQDGKFYKGSISLEVALGGCEG